MKHARPILDLGSLPSSEGYLGLLENDRGKAVKIARLLAQERDKVYSILDNSEKEISVVVRRKKSHGNILFCLEQIQVS